MRKLVDFFNEEIYNIISAAAFHLQLVEYDTLQAGTLQSYISGSSINNYFHNKIKYQYPLQRRFKHDYYILLSYGSFLCNNNYTMNNNSFQSNLSCKIVHKD